MDQIDENEEPGLASNNDVEENISETDDDHDCDSDNYHNEDENDPQATKKRSKYWQYFKIIVKDSGTRFAQCQINGCKKKYKVSGKSNGGTGNLARHLRKSHTEVVVSDLPHDEPFTFSQEKFRKALLKWIVACDQPFTAPQEEAFVELIRTLNPDAHIYSDKTIKKDELTEYLTKFDELKEEIAKVSGKISITMDSWTSKNWIPFLAIRGHWIDDDWNYKSKLLDFAYIEGNHSGEKHSQIFIKCVERLKLPFSKILAITLDNASNNDTLFKWLIEHGLSPERNQVRCMPHIINLAAQDILKSLNVPATEDNADLEDEELEDIDLDLDIIVDELGEEADVDLADGAVISKLRVLVRKIRKSVQLRQKLKKLCEKYSMKYLVPVIDVATRWNSTNYMILRAEELKLPLTALCIHEKSLRNFSFTQSEWDELDKVQKLLVKFDRATKLMSMERHSVNSSYLPTLNWLINSLTEYVEENSDALSIAAEAGIQKLKKYESLINETTLLFICTFLNPALKLTYFKEHYSRNAVRDITKKVSDYFTEFYAPPADTKTRKRAADTSDDEDTFRNHMFKRSKVSNEPTEIKYYINLPLADPDVDIIEYWKNKRNEFPLMSSMARDILPIQPSSVSVERDFAGGVDVVTPNRCSLYYDTIQAIMCLKSWYKN